MSDTSVVDPEVYFLEFSDRDFAWQRPHEKGTVYSSGVAVLKDVSQFRINASRAFTVAVEESTVGGIVAGHTPTLEPSVVMQRGEHNRLVANLERNCASRGELFIRVERHCLIFCHSRTLQGARQ